MIFYSKPMAKTTMPNFLNPHAELHCQIPILSICIPIIYNLLVLLVACIFGIVTRKLPENFKESRNICICALTSITLWGAFLPTYFLTNFHLYKGILLSLGLLLHSLINITTIFVPKVYAAAVVTEKQECTVTFKYSQKSNSKADSSVLKMTK